MPAPAHRLSELLQLVRRESRELFSFSASDRPWEMPLAAAISAGVPVLVATGFGRMADGVVASLAGMAFLYLPSTPMPHRMAVLMACCFGMIGCYTAGLLGHLVPLAEVPLITSAAILVTMICRYFRVGVPGSLFFIMPMAIGTFAPGTLAELPYRIGLFAMGCMFAWAVGLIYSVYILKRRPADPLVATPPAEFEFVYLEPVIIGLSVGLSLAIALLLQLDKPYWVPVSCLVVVQGVTLRAAWNKQVQRIVGTSVGLILAGALLSLTTDPWVVAIAILVLTFVIETAVVRHYALAAVFITPLTILLAEAPDLQHGNVGALMQARFLDTLLGAAIGFVAAIALHNPGFRRRTGDLLRRIIPARMYASGT